MTRPALLCHRCNTLVVSLHRHDYRQCKCGDVAVDGGGDYFKVAIMPGADCSQVRVKVKTRIYRVVERPRPVQYEFLTSMFEEYGWSAA